MERKGLKITSIVFTSILLLVTLFNLYVFIMNVALLKSPVEEGEALANVIAFALALLPLLFIVCCGGLFLGIGAIFFTIFASFKSKAFLILNIVLTVLDVILIPILLIIA